MQRALLILRAVVEGLIGLLFTISAPVQLVKALGVLGSPAYTGGYLAGTLVGIGIFLTAGILLLRDAFGVFKRAVRPADAVPMG